MSTIMHILLFIFCLVIFLCSLSYYIRDIPKFIPIDDYPKVTIIINNKQILIDELIEYNKTRRWTKYDNDHIINNKKILEKMEQEDIQKYLKTYNGVLNASKPTLRIFWLRLNRKLVDQNIFFCPKSVQIISQVDNVINAGIMAFEPGYVGEKTVINQTDFYSYVRCYIPLFIPDGDNGIEIGGKKLNWRDVEDLNNNIMFDDQIYHKFWNFSTANTIILVLDIEK